MSETSVKTRTNFKMSVTDPSVIKPLQIANFKSLHARAVKVCAPYMHKAVTPKEARQIHIKMNKVSRAFNNQRKAINKPYRLQSKSAKQLVDELRDPFKQVADRMNKVIKADRQHRKDLLRADLAPDMHTICQARGIHDLEVPADALKMSLSKAKRLDLMAGYADKQKAALQKSQCFPMRDGRAVNAATGEIVPNLQARNLIFVGDSAAYKKLIQLANQHHISLREAPTK